MFRTLSIGTWKIFIQLPGLAWEAALRNTKVKLKLLIDSDMLLMIEKGIRGGISHYIIRYVKAKYMKIKIKI